MTKAEKTENVINCQDEVMLEVAATIAEEEAKVMDFHELRGTSEWDYD